MRDVKRILDSILEGCNIQFSEKALNDLQEYLDKLVGETPCAGLHPDTLATIKFGLEFWGMNNISADCMLPPEFVKRFLEAYCAKD